MANYFFFILIKFLISNSMLHKKYIKKVIVTDNDASAEARGNRLRKIRNLSNLSRKDLCNIESLNLNTYKGWELARFGGLPIDGAEKVIKRVYQENVICDIEWLLYGKGQEPYILPKTNIVSNQDKNTLVLKEILFFQSLYPNATYFTVNDNTLLPYYKPGDYVAGIKIFGENIKTALDQICIVELTNGDTFVRYLKACQDKESYRLISTNIDRTIENEIFLAELHFIAPVIRHYKIFPS